MISAPKIMTVGTVKGLTTWTEPAGVIIADVLCDWMMICKGGRPYELSFSTWSPVICLCAGWASGALESTLEYGSLGKLALHAPSTEPSHVVLFVSGDAGWAEIDHLGARAVLCISGTDETSDSLFTQLKGGQRCVVGVPGCHHFRGNCQAPLNQILTVARIEQK